MFTSARRAPRNRPERTSATSERPPPMPPPPAQSCARVANQRRASRRALRTSAARHVGDTLCNRRSWRPHTVSARYTIVRARAQISSRARVGFDGRSRNARKSSACVIYHARARAVSIAQGTHPQINRSGRSRRACLRDSPALSIRAACTAAHSPPPVASAAASVSCDRARIARAAARATCVHTRVASAQ